MLTSNIKYCRKKRNTFLSHSRDYWWFWRNNTQFFLRLIRSTCSVPNIRIDKVVNISWTHLKNLSSLSSSLLSRLFSFQSYCCSACESHSRAGSPRFANVLGITRLILREKANCKQSSFNLNSLLLPWTWVLHNRKRFNSQSSLWKREFEGRDESSRIDSLTCTFTYWRPKMLHQKRRALCSAVIWSLMCLVIMYILFYVQVQVYKWQTFYTRLFWLP